MFTKISWTTVIVSAVVTIIVGFLFLWIFIYPSDNSIEMSCKDREDNVKIAVKRLDVKVSKDSLAINRALNTGLDQKLSFQEAYGLDDGESTNVIPTYNREVEVKISVDKDGKTITEKVDSTIAIVPPVLNWRDWIGLQEKLGYIPTKVISEKETTDNNESEDGVKYFKYYYQPVFSGTTAQVTKVVKKDSPAVNTPAAKSGKIVF